MIMLLKILVQFLGVSSLFQNSMGLLVGFVTLMVAFAANPFYFLLLFSSFESKKTRKPKILKNL